MKTKLFEYILISLLKRQAILNKTKWSDINLTNDFGKDKIILFPFLICMANYKYNRNKLADLFNCFKANEFGVVDIELSQYMNLFFTACSILPKKTIIHPNLISQLDAPNNQTVRYSKYFEISNLNEIELYDAIDKGIDILCYATKNEILNYSVERLSIDVRKHALWETYFFALKGKTINPVHVKTSRSIFSPEKEFLQLSL